MKLFSPRLLVFASVLCLLPAVASAAADMYIKIKGVDGEAKVVRCPDGACVIDGLAPGRYTVEVCDARGNVIPTDIELGCTVQSAREASSGMATGKRMHKPLRITADMGAAPANVVEVTEAGMQVILTAPGAAAPVQDHNSSRSNKSSN